MDVYTALRDPVDGRPEKTQLIGPFSTEDKARDACQTDADEYCDVTVDDPERQILEWKEDSAQGPDGYVYVVILGELDRPTGT